MTGIGDNRTSRSAFEPINTRDNPVRPWLPTIIILAIFFSAISMILDTGVPTTKSGVAFLIWFIQINHCFLDQFCVVLAETLYLFQLIEW